MKTAPKNIIALISIIVIAIATYWAVHRFHKPGQLDVITAQAMDMSQMRPPTGAAPVGLVSVRQGSLNDTVTYTGSVKAYNEQDISPRITGTLLSLPVYPGDQVHAGQLIAQLDTSEVGAKADQAVQQAREAQIATQVAHLTHHLHHGAALEQATAQVQAALQGVSDSEAQAQANMDAVAAANAEVQSAQVNANYWKTEIVREKQLADAGAASRQEYQNELAQAQAAFAAVNQARAKVNQARAMARSTQAKVLGARRQVDVARAGVRMAQADLEVAQGQALEAGAGASAARAAAKEAAIVEGYARIISPANGVVTERPVAPGTLIQPGTVILKVAEIDRVRVQANVAAADLNGIHPGTPVKIVSQDGSQPLTATVTAVFPSANAQTRTAVVEAIVPNTNHRFMPGAFVTMRFTKDNPNTGLLVPAQAILSEGGQSYLWVARGGNESPDQTSATGGIGGAAVSGQYKALGCGMLYSAADAKKLNYICPMDKSKIVPVTAAPPPADSGSLTAHRVPVIPGPSDGTLIEVTSPEIHPRTRIVIEGRAGLSEGVRLVETSWGENGPKSLPKAGEISGGGTRYECEVCGLIFSAEDAKKNNFIDPMDGGKLVPVKSK